MPNPHYQNLLDDREVFKSEYQKAYKGILSDEVLAKGNPWFDEFLKVRRLIEWKKEVERWKRKAKHHTGALAVLEVNLLQEAVALTEAEK